jgi:hypothetical protein
VGVSPDEIDLHFWFNEFNDKEKKSSANPKAGIGKPGKEI